MMIALIGHKQTGDFWSGEHAPESTLTIRLRNRGKTPEQTLDSLPGDGNLYLCKPRGGELVHIPGEHGVAVAFWADSERSAQVLGEHVGGSGSPAERVAHAYYERRREGAEGTLESLVNLVRDAPKEARFAVVAWQAFSLGDGVQVYCQGVPIIRSISGTAILLSQALLPNTKCAKAIDYGIGQRYGVIPYRCP